MAYGLKNVGWESEKAYCAGPGLIVFGMTLRYWFSDSLSDKLKTKRTLVKLTELVLFTAGIVIFSYGLKDTSWESKQIAATGGVLLALGYCLRDFAVEKGGETLTNSLKLYLVVFAIAAITLLSATYSNSEDCNCEDRLTEIEGKIDDLRRY
jgi:cytochrome c oxidase assembly factor CtaG